jgi:N-acetylmuramoyl-L-alanine amidase
MAELEGIKLKIEKLIIHHSLTKDGQVVDWNAIRRYHVEVNGWDDIGYHWGIERVGNVYVMQTGRLETMAGAHTKGMNGRSLGICVVGNYDLDVPAGPTMDLLADLCARKCRKYGLRPEDIETHHRYAEYKTCPGRLFPMDELRRRVEVVLEGVRREA